MIFDKQCNNCEFNADGVCIEGNKKTIQEDGTQCCESWNANLDYFSEECIKAPRFLREKYHDYRLTYSEFSQQFSDYRKGIDIPISFFDAVKYIYGLSVVDIAVLADVSYSVVYQAKVKKIPQRRIKQFCTSLCIPEHVILKDTTACFDDLKKGKALLFSQDHVEEKLLCIPAWKQSIVDSIADNYLSCPVSMAKVFSRIDKMYWERGMDISEYNESEEELITYYREKYKNVVSIEYYLDMFGVPHIYTRMR